jgi:hypothetical protein
MMIYLPQCPTFTKMPMEALLDRNRELKIFVSAEDLDHLTSQRYHVGLIYNSDGSQNPKRILQLALIPSLEELPRTQIHNLLKVGITPELLEEVVKESFCRYSSIGNIPEFVEITRYNTDDEISGLPSQVDSGIPPTFIPRKNPLAGVVSRTQLPL